jgi:predicted MFS family arabinose efflux permease
MASLGLYSYVTLIQAGSPNSLSMTLFSWGLGGFLGSSLVGIFTDRTGNARVAMAVILAGLMATIISIPFTKDLPFIGLIPFFMWGVFGWAIPTPQQQILFELHEDQGTILAAINSSALGLGAALGTAIGGLIISSGFKEIDLPFPSACLLLFVLVAQLILITKSNSKKVFCT